MDFKNTLIKSITAVLCVVALCITMVSVVGDFADAKIEAAKTMGSASSSTVGGSESSDDTATDEGTVSDDTVTDEGTVPEDGTVAEDGATQDDAATEDATQAPSDDKSPTEAAKPQTNAAPKTVAEITDYYNNAVAKAVKAKVGFNKTRTSDNEKIDMPAILGFAKGLIYQFMGIGPDNKYEESVTKGKWGDVSFLYNSKLTAADVTSATCTQSGANYVITLKLKPGSSAANKSNPTTPANTSLDKCGICVGTEDKGYFDHKTASVMYDAIAGTDANANISEKYSNAVVKATINAATGNIVSLTVDWDMDVSMKVMGVSATATGSSHVTYKDFKY